MAPKWASEQKQIINLPQEKLLHTAHTQALARKSGVSSKLGFSVGNITFL